MQEKLKREISIEKEQSNKNDKKVLAREEMNL